jgi:hypothetical protein
MRIALMTTLMFLLPGCGGGAGDAVATNVIDASFDGLEADVGHDAGTDVGKDAGAIDASQGDAGCGPWTCSGCCSASGDCVEGTDDAACGSSGVICVNCAAQGSMCELMACLNCTPSCNGKVCGAGDGCGKACDPGSGCCTPSCDGKVCGSDDGCGSPCAAGSGCCTPSCGSKLCGDADGCGGTCAPGSGCCAPSCSGKDCGDSDGCGDTCDGDCPGFEYCNSSKKCACGPSPNYVNVGGTCLPSCGKLLDYLGLPNSGQGCCPNGCKAGTFGGGPGSTHDCTYCCSSTGTTTCQ